MTTLRCYPPLSNLCALAISVCSNGSSLYHDAPLNIIILVQIGGQVGEGGRKISREKVKLKHVGHSSVSVLNTYSLDDIVHPKIWSGQWGKKSC